MIKAIIFDFYGVLAVQGESGATDKPNEPLLSYIKWVLKPNYKLGVISNAGGEHMYDILPKEDCDMFDDVVLSYKFGKAKPDPAIYEESLKNLGVSAGESIFIDDIQRFCLAAEQLDMRSIWYQSFDQMKDRLDKVLKDNV